MSDDAETMLTRKLRRDSQDMLKSVSEARAHTKVLLAAAKGAERRKYISELRRIDMVEAAAQLMLATTDIKGDDDKAGQRKWNAARRKVERLKLACERSRT